MAEESTSYNQQTVSLGEQLRRAREAKKLTTEKVAAELRVRDEVIVNLEAENWQQLYGRTYARGYFINYVKFLGLPQNVLMAAFTIHYKADDTTSDSGQALAIKSVRKKAVKPLLIGCSLVAVSFAALLLFLPEGSLVSSSNPEIKRMSHTVEEQSS